MNIAIIPARGGSKRIPSKNIKDFAGKPVIAYAIEAAIKTKLFDRIIVSTDDQKIAKIARDYGAETPFVRDAHLADDHIHIGPVIEHCIQWLLDAGLTAQYICTIFATAPLISYQDIMAAFNIISSNDRVGNVTAIAKFSAPVQRALKITESGLLKMIQPENFSKRSQDLEQAYFEAGQFSWSRLTAIIPNADVTEYDSVPFIIPRHRAQDIDTLEDWEFAEMLYQVLKLE